MSAASIFLIEKYNCVICENRPKIFLYATPHFQNSIYNYNSSARIGKVIALSIF